MFMSLIERVRREDRREITAQILRVPFPFRVHEQNPEKGLELAEEYLSGGKGLIVPTPHFSNGDFQRILEALVINIKKTRERDILIPIAAHRLYQPGLKFLAKAGDLYLAPIVTKHTIEKDDKRIEQGMEAIWKPEKRKRTLEYLTQAGKTLKAGGIIVLAPQAERHETLEPFGLEPIRALGWVIKKNQIDLENIAIMPLGLEIRKQTNYSQEKIGGYNPLKKYHITIGEVLRLSEVAEKAQMNSHTIDEEVFEMMNTIAPEAYKSKTTILNSWTTDEEI